MSTPTILEKIKAYKLAEVAAAKVETPLEAVEAQASEAGPTRGFAEALRARRDHLPYLHRLLRRLEREERDGLIEQLCRHVSTRMDAPRFAQRLEKLAAAR